MTIITSQKLTHLVVTRPLAQANSLVRRIHALQDDSLVVQQIPLLDIQPINFDIPPMNQFDGIIFISSNAVQHFYSSNEYLNQKHAFKHSQLLAVGDNTANSIELVTAQTAIFPQQMNAEGLLQLPNLQSIAAQNWLIVKGKGGRQIIKDTLIERKAIVTEIDVYQRKLPDLNDQKKIINAQAKQPVWLITSNEAMSNLYRILGLAEKPQHRTQIIISSDRLAAQASLKGFAIIAQSVGASELQLLECIQTLLCPTTNKDR